VHDCYANKLEKPNQWVFIEFYWCLIFNCQFKLGFAKKPKLMGFGINGSWG